MEPEICDSTGGRQILIWLAHDDALHDRFIEECLACLNQNPRAVLVSSDFQIIDESGAHIRTEILSTIREEIPWGRRCRQFFQYPIYLNVFYCFYGMMRADAGRMVLSGIKEPKYMSQIELPVLARLATMGEITSLPKILREYRRVSTSLYHSEINSLAKKSIFARTIAQGRHIFGLIIDQLSVLLGSKFSTARKLRVLVHVGAFYFAKLVEICIGQARSRGALESEAPPRPTGDRGE